MKKLDLNGQFVTPEVLRVVAGFLVEGEDVKITGAARCDDETTRVVMLDVSRIESNLKFAKDLEEVKRDTL